MTIEPAARGGTAVRHQAELDLKGLARMVAPMPTLAISRPGETAAQQMCASLGRVSR